MLGDLLVFLNQETALFEKEKNLVNFFSLVSLGFFLIPTKLAMGSIIYLKVIQSSLKPEVFSWVYHG